MDSCKNLPMMCPTLAWLYYFSNISDTRWELGHPVFMLYMEDAKAFENENLSVDDVKNFFDTEIDENGKIRFWMDLIVRISMIKESKLTYKKFRKQYDKKLKPTQDMFWQMLKDEIQMRKKGYLAFYHARVDLFVFMEYAIDKYYEYSKIPATPVTIFPSCQTLDRDEAILDASKMPEKLGLSKYPNVKAITDHIDLAKKILVSGNYSIFGNLFSYGEGTYFFWRDNRSVALDKAEEFTVLGILSEFIENERVLELTEKWISKYWKLRQTTSKKYNVRSTHGQYIAFFVPCSVLEHYIYNSKAFGSASPIPIKDYLKQYLNLDDDKSWDADANFRSRDAGQVRMVSNFKFI
jgi:hypothetical protein